MCTFSQSVKCHVYNWYENVKVWCIQIRWKCYIVMCKQKSDNDSLGILISSIIRTKIVSPSEEMPDMLFIIFWRKDTILCKAVWYDKIFFILLKKWKKCEFKVFSWLKCSEVNFVKRMSWTNTLSYIVKIFILFQTHLETILFLKLEKIIQFWK